MIDLDEDLSVGESYYSSKRRLTPVDKFIQQGGMIRHELLIFFNPEEIARAS